MLSSMEVTEEVVKDRFQFFNHELFGGALRMPQFSVKHYTFVAGQIRAKEPRATIIISSCFDFDTDSLDEVIIHEMIHYWLWRQGDKGAFRHGSSFRLECRRIKDSYGLAIHATGRHIRLKTQYPIPLYERVIWRMLSPMRLVATLIDRW